MPGRHGPVVAGAIVAATTVIATLVWMQAGERIERTDNDLDVIARAGTRAPAGEFLYPEPDGAMVYKYAPGSAFYFTPLSWIDPGARSAIWFVVTIVGVLVNGALIRWGVLGLSGPVTWRDAAGFALMLAVVVTPLRRHVTNGQVDIIILILTNLVAAAAARGRLIAAGAVWIGAVSLKVAPALLAIHLFQPRLRRTWGALAGAAIAAAALVAIPTAVWGVNTTILQHRGWIERLTMTTPETLVSIRNQSIAGVIARLTSPSEATGQIMSAPPAIRMAMTIMCALALVALVVAIIRRTSDSQVGNAISYSAALAAVPMLSPVSWDATYLLLMPAAGVWLATRRAARGPSGAALFWTGAVLLNVVISSVFMAYGPRVVAGVLILAALYRRAVEVARDGARG